MPPHAGASSQAIDLSQSISPLDNFDFSKFAYQNDLMHGGGAGGPGGGGGGAESYNWLSTVDSSQSDPSSIYSGSPSPPGEFTHPVQVHVHAPQPHHAAGGAPLGVWKDVGSGATTTTNTTQPQASGFALSDVDQISLGGGGGGLPMNYAQQQQQQHHHHHGQE